MTITTGIRTDEHHADQERADHEGASTPVDGVTGAPAPPRLPGRVVPALLLAGILPILNVPNLIVPAFSGRFALCLALAGLGVPVLAVLAVRERIRLAGMALAWLGWAGLATLASDRPLQSLWGPFAWGTGWLLLAGLAGALAVGLVASSHRRQLGWALVAGALLNAAVAVAQVASTASPAGLGAYQGRAKGLLGNPVFLGTLLAGAAALTAADWQRQPRLWLLPAVALLAGGVDASGSRSALLVLALVALVALVRRPRRAVPLLLAVAVGVGAVNLVAADPGRNGAGSRLAQAPESGLAARRAAWGAGVDATTERPLTGWGPGRFQAATSQRLGLDYVRAEGAGRLFLDAHNWAVESVTTTGVVGFALLVALLVTALRRADPTEPWVWCVAAMLLVGLLEPMSVVVTPLVFLGLGVVGGRGRERRLPVLATVAGGLAGLSMAAAVVVGGFALDQARLDFDPGWARTAATLLPAWSEPHEQRARIAVLDALDKGARTIPPEAVAERRRAADLDPAAPRPQATAADALLSTGHPGLSRTYLRRSLAHDAWFPPTLNLLARLDIEAGNTGEARHLLRRSLTVAPRQPAARRLLESLG